MKHHYGILVITLILFCGTIAGQDYTPTKESVPDINRYKARLILDQLLTSCSGSYFFKMGWDVSMHDPQPEPIVKDSVLIFKFSEKRVSICKYSSLKIPSIEHNKTKGFHLILPTEDSYPFKYVWIIGIEKDVCKRILDALFILKNKDQNSADLSDLENFKLIAQQYRSQVTKPDLDENARRYLVQATTQTEEKHYGEAIDHLEKALSVEPAYPQAYFNRALLWAQVNIYGAAILEMKKYLMLVPDAPDARASQDKIYEWEGKLNK